MYLSLQNFQINNRIVRVLLVAMLIFCMVFCAFVFQLETAHAFALSGFALSVIASILISCGFTFLTQEDLESACRSFFDFLSSDTVTILTGIISSVGSAGDDAIVKAPPALISAVSSWFSAQDWTGFEEAGTTMMGGFTLPSVNKVDIDGMNFDWCNVYSESDWKSSSIKLCDSLPMSYPFSLPVSGDNNITNYKSITIVKEFSNILIKQVGLNDTVSFFPVNSSITGFCIVQNYKSFGEITECMLMLSVASGGALGIPLTGTDSQVTTTTFPRTEQKVDTTYFPNGVTAGNPSTTFPSNTASKPLTPDIPINVPSDVGTLVGAPAGSTRGDVTTGEGELTITGWLSKLWDGIQSIPGSLAGAIAGFFTPPLGMWDGFIADVITVVSPPGTVNFDNYVSSIAIPDVTGTFKGKTLTFVDNQMLRDNVATWRKYIGAFLAVLIVIYNYNMFMKLMGMGTLTLTDSGRVFVPNGVQPPKGGKE